MMRRTGTDMRGERREETTEETEGLTWEKEERKDRKSTNS